MRLLNEQWRDRSAARGIFLCLLATGVKRERGDRQLSARSTEAYEGGVGARWPSYVFWASVVRNSALSRTRRRTAPRGACRQALHPQRRPKQDHLFGGSVWCSMRAPATGACMRRTCSVSARLPRISTVGGCFMVWKHALSGEDQQKHARIVGTSDWTDGHVRGWRIRGSARVTANATAALLAKHRASRGLTRL